MKKKTTNFSLKVFQVGCNFLNVFISFAARLTRTKAIRLLKCWMGSRILFFLFFNFLFFTKNTLLCDNCFSCCVSNTNTNDTKCRLHCCAFGPKGTYTHTNNIYIYKRKYMLFIISLSHAATSNYVYVSLKLFNFFFYATDNINRSEKIL